MQVKHMMHVYKFQNETSYVQTTVKNTVAGGKNENYQHTSRILNNKMSP